MLAEETKAVSGADKEKDGKAADKLRVDGDGVKSREGAPKEDVGKKTPIDADKAESVGGRPSLDKSTKDAGKQGDTAGGEEKLPVTLSSVDAKIDSLSTKLVHVQREIWYTRIALAMFLIINLVFIRLCISDVNDTMGMFLQFMMSTLQGGGE